MVTYHKQHVSLLKIIAILFWVPQDPAKEENDSPCSLLINDLSLNYCSFNKTIPLKE